MTVGDGWRKFDHVASVMFETRSFDNLLGQSVRAGESPTVGEGKMTAALTSWKAIGPA